MNAEEDVDLGSLIFTLDCTLKEHIQRHRSYNPAPP